MASLVFENPKDPKDIAPYTFNWDAHVIDPETGERNDTLESAVSALVVGDGPDDLVVGTTVIMGDRAVVMISNGTPGQSYVVECTATFESGKVLNRSAKLKIKDL